MLSDDFKSKVIDIVENCGVVDTSNLIDKIGDKMNMGRIFTSEETDYIYELVKKWNEFYD